MLPRVEIYTKRDCCLCDEAKEVLARVRNDVPFELAEIDIESDSTLMERFRTEIPVIFVGGRKAFKYRVDEQELRRRLAR